MRSTSGASVAVLAALLVLAACEREEVEEIDAEEMSREEQQAAPAGLVVAETSHGADPARTIYEPPPELSRTDVGVVYVPGAPPPPAPGDTAPGVEGRTEQAVRAAGAIPPSAGDTTARPPPRRLPQDTLR